MTPRTRVLAIAAAAAVAACGSSAPAEAPPGAPPPNVENDAMAPGHPETSDPGGPPTDHPGGEPMPTEGDEVAPEAATSPVSDDEITAFADVQVEVLQLTEKAQERAQAGESPDALRAELEEEAAQVIEASPLTMNRFQEIILLAQRDPALRQQLEASVRAKVDATP